MRWPGLPKLLGLAVIVFYLASAFTPLPNILGRWTGSQAQLEVAEAIVVLGGEVQPGGVLGNSSLRRAIHGIVLYRRGLAPLLVFLGQARGEGHTESAIRAELARQMGIPPEMILSQAGARTTREEAVRVGEVLQPMGVRRILLVTNSQHMARARALFERAGFDVFAAPADDLSNFAESPQDRLQLMRRVLQELLARLYYRAAGYL